METDSSGFFVSCQDDFVDPKTLTSLITQLKPRDVIDLSSTPQKKHDSMKILITGGAGFIGSNLAASLVDNPSIELVRVLDNLSNGKLENIRDLQSSPKFEFIEGDIRDANTCSKVIKGIHTVSHQAALGSVPRSIAHPDQTHDHNVNGFLQVLEAARKDGVKRFVYASSSSVYGDLSESPKVEARTGRVLSPYAASKMTNELYAEAYSRSYGMQLFGFRYFNVFGPKQDPDGPYAAVIPLFIKAALTGEQPIINGDGSITRDFTPVENVVQVNTHALMNEFEGAFHHPLNVACGQTTNLNELWQLIAEITQSDLQPVHGPLRKGDILHSLADVSKAREVLGYKPETDLHKTMEATIDWYRKHIG